MLVCRASDKIVVTMGPLTFRLSPLTAEQKGKLVRFTEMKAGDERVDGYKAALLAIKMSLKSVDGLELADGSTWNIEHDPEGLVTQESMDILTQIGDHLVNLTKVCLHLGLKEMSDPGLEGVKVSFEQGKVKKK